MRRPRPRPYARIRARPASLPRGRPSHPDDEGHHEPSSDYTRRGLSRKTLVTGGAGFIGSNLVRELLDRGDDVRVLDNYSTGNRRNIAGLDVEIVEGELRSYE